MKTLIWLAWLASAGGDLATTHGAIARGAHESYPTTAGMNNATRDAVVLGASGAMACALTCTPFYQEHPRVAWVITGVAAGLHSWAAVHNTHQGGH
jgi:hypothetical protein